MKMLQFVVEVFEVVGVMDLDATVGPCQQFASVVKMYHSMIDHCRFECDTMGPCPWLIVVVVVRAHDRVVLFDQR